ncbi:DNA replication and repair protein RecF [Clostridia bacterium]|nr:DNA replication and repair protein RecF [Clostridia bacterium]
MTIDNVTIECFRNIRSAQIAFPPGITYLTGGNGSGKTSALEAIYCAAIGKPFRARIAAEAITYGEAQYKIDAVCTYKDAETRLGIVLSREDKKYYVGGIETDGAKDFLGNLRAVLFTPDHLSIVKGGSEARRRFADGAISQMSPSFLRYVTDYGRLLVNRNSVLRQLRGRVFDDSARNYLWAWTEKTIKYAAAITRYRGEYAARLGELAPDFYREIAEGDGGQAEKLAVSYSSSGDGVSALDSFKDTAKIEELYARTYERRLGEELHAGTTLAGPHRDDISFTLNLRNARNSASQGQQRSAVIALKFAEGEIAKTALGSYPVFLLDDILSELDSSRRGYLIEKLRDRQSVITCTDAELPDDSGGFICQVEGGEFKCT